MDWDDIKHTMALIMDGFSVASIISTFANILPHIAALFGVLWWGIRIWETETIKRLTGRWKD